MIRKAEIDIRTLDGALRRVRCGRQIHDSDVRMLNEESTGSGILTITIIVVANVRTNTRGEKVETSYCQVSNLLGLSFGKVMLSSVKSFVWWFYGNC